MLGVSAGGMCVAQACLRELEVERPIVLAAPQNCYEYLDIIRIHPMHEASAGASAGVKRIRVGVVQARLRELDKRAPSWWLPLESIIIKQVSSV